MNYEQKIYEARNIADIFEIVKELVKRYLKEDHAGILVGVSDLGTHQQGFIGAYYSIAANMIIINKKPLQMIRESHPMLYNPYLFHVVLHEYVHAIGSFDEAQTRTLVKEMSMRYFGENNVITQFATNIEKFLPYLTAPTAMPEDISIEFVKGIDRTNINYIG